jgi:hypothetical protein
VLLVGNSLRRQIFPKLDLANPEKACSQIKKARQLLNQERRKIRADKNEAEMANDQFMLKTAQVKRPSSLIDQRPQLTA